MRSFTAKVSRIGNAKGILFTKAILDEIGVKDTVEITVKNKIIILSASKRAKKKDWLDVRKSKQNISLVTNVFDETEWT